MTRLAAVFVLACAVVALPLDALPFDSYWSQPLAYSEPLSMRTRGNPFAGSPFTYPEYQVPSRSLSFSGYLSGAESGGPFAFSRTPDRTAWRHAPEDPPSSTEEPPIIMGSTEEEMAHSTTTGSAPTEAPPPERKNHGPTRAPHRPSFSIDPAPVFEHFPDQQYPGRDDDNSDRGGYGTIYAWFPQNFGGWPVGKSAGPSASRGYDRPPVPGGRPPNVHRPGGGHDAVHRPSGDPASEEGYGPSSEPSGDEDVGNSPYYPVAIANSFSTGRNAMASSSATAFGGPAPESTRVRGPGGKRNRHTE